MSAFPVDQEPRYEIKLVTREVGRPALLAQMRLLPCGIRKLYPPRRVQSVYLDTHGGRALQDNLAGVSDREKIRFRWYGDATAKVTGKLERKIRVNMLGTKEVLALPEPMQIEGACRHAFVPLLRRQVSPLWRERLAAGLEPVQWIAYQREYLTTADRAVRITIDHGLLAVDLRNAARLSAACPQPIPRLLVVECKAAKSHWLELEAVVQSLPLRVDKCSKFVLGSAPTHAPSV